MGDLYAVGSTIAVRSKVRPGTTPPVYDYDPAGEWFFFSQSHGSSGRCVKQPDNEKPTGEWNTVELICFRNDSIHIVNGKVVMRLHEPCESTPICRRRSPPVRSFCSRRGRRSFIATSRFGRSKRSRPSTMEKR